MSPNHNVNCSYIILITLVLYDPRVTIGYTKKHIFKCTGLDCICLMTTRVPQVILTVLNVQGQVLHMYRTGFSRINSLAPGRFEWNFIFKLISVIDGWGISYETAIRWMSLDLNADKSSLVQVMVWGHQATCHYLSQCWPKSMSSYGVTGTQWAKHGKTSMFKVHLFPSELFTFISNPIIKPRSFNSWHSRKLQIGPQQFGWNQFQPLFFYPHESEMQYCRRFQQT